MLAWTRKTNGKTFNATHWKIAELKDETHCVLFAEYCDSCHNIFRRLMCMCLKYERTTPRQ